MVFYCALKPLGCSVVRRSFAQLLDGDNRCLCLQHVPPAVLTLDPLQALSNTVWSYSKLGVMHDQLLNTVAAVTLRKLHTFNAQNIANTVSLTNLYLCSSCACVPKAFTDAVC